MAKKKGNNYIIDKENNIAKIELRRRNKESLWATIDLDDLQRVVIDFGYAWFTDYNEVRDLFYVKSCIYTGDKTKSNHKCVLLHKYILNYFGNKKVDHINHDTLDNRKCNLRIIENKLNTKNRKGKNSNNKSGYRNVSWIGEKWTVQLQINGINTALARFPKEQLKEAGEFAELMRQKYYGEFAGNG